MNLLLTIMMSLSIMLMWLNHPLSMGLMLICQTMIMSMIIGLSLGSFLFSYIIMIIMLSGALVLFIYMASVASNEKFQTSIKLLIMFIIINIIIYVLMCDNSNKSSFIDMNIKMETMTLIKLYGSMSAYITMMMIMYLLLTMIVVSNIATVSEGPLRMKT
uniref:NADH-ubiquinone oxidoreductase chain 6 n=1 Tax=Coridius brunneus TaxID=696877 RepID=A0A8E7BDV6_9HEMI|nr:NADH dehydrogenase subunit 6 [Coridius brunneus]